MMTLLPGYLIALIFTNFAVFRMLPEPLFSILKENIPPCEEVSNGHLVFTADLFNIASVNFSLKSANN